MIFVQRHGTVGDVDFTGDAARVLKDGQVVVGWTVGGVIHDLPQGDGYTLEVRTGSTVASDSLAVGVVVLALGQSGVQRWFSDPTAVPSPSNGAYRGRRRDGRRRPEARPGSSPARLATTSATCR